VGFWSKTRAVQHCNIQGIEHIQLVTDPHSLSFYHLLAPISEGRIPTSDVPMSNSFRINSNSSGRLPSLEASRCRTMVEW